TRVFDTAGAIDAGVIDEDIQATKFTFAGGNCRAPVVCTRDVEMKRHGGLARGLGVDFIGGPLADIVEHIANHPLRALIREETRLGGTLSARTAGDESDLAFESFHFEGSSDSYWGFFDP